MEEAIPTDKTDAREETVARSGGSRIVRDVAYGPDPAHRLDVYLPDEPKDAPVLFMVHGGAWQFGDKAAKPVVANKVAHWVPKGYILVSTNYRLSPPDPLQQIQDIGMALAFAQSQAPSWGGDPDRFVLIGHSSGAHLVSLLASDSSVAAEYEARAWLGTVALDSAAFDVGKIMQRRHMPFYDRVFRDDPSYWRQASPMHRLNAAPYPMFLVCSSDRRASCAQARGFADKVSGLGGRVQLSPVALSHKEINEKLGTTGEYTKSVDSFLQSLGLP